jgi:transposase InsO family protein
MLKAKYCDREGRLVDFYPSFYQFRYFYRKTKKLQTYYIARNGLKNYQRNNRPLTGDGVQSFASAPGVGMLDATICDIYLINEANQIVGRPILTACVDAFSGLCCGYSLSWEGGVYSIRNLMWNVVTDKEKHCGKHGITITKEQWPSSQMPGKLVTDMGSEYKSETFEQIAELGVTVVNLPSYRPELKGPVEKFFDLIQNSYKPFLKGKGVIEPDYQERGAHDYRKDACLTMEEFEKIVLHCIIFYNSKRIVENFPYTDEMLEENIKPYANAIWNWGVKQIGANLIEVSKESLMLTLLPRTAGIFSRFGLKVNKTRYHHENYDEKYLQGNEVTVAYNPEDISSVWVIENGKYIKFELIESRYKGKNLGQLLEMKQEQKDLIRSEQKCKTQAEVELASHIQAIASVSGMKAGMGAEIKNIRSTRKKEQVRKHIDYIKEAGVNEYEESAK